MAQPKLNSVEDESIECSCLMWLLQKCMGDLNEWKRHRDNKKAKIKQKEDVES